MWINTVCNADILFLWYYGRQIIEFVFAQNNYNY